jgi:hypothetical protein
MLAKMAFFMLSNLVLTLPFGHAIERSASAQQVAALHPALSAARMADPRAVARVLAETIGVDPAAGGAWLVDLRGFDGAERAELCDALRSEGVPLADRSKLRRLIAAEVVLSSPLEDTTRAGAEQQKQSSPMVWGSTPHDFPRRQLQSDGNGGSMDSIALVVTALLGIASYLVQARQTQAASAAQHRLGRELAERDKAEQKTAHQLTRLQEELSEFIFPMYTAGTNLMQAWWYGALELELADFVSLHGLETFSLDATPHIETLNFVKKHRAVGNNAPYWRLSPRDISSLEEDPERRGCWCSAVEHTHLPLLRQMVLVMSGCMHLSDLPNILVLDEVFRECGRSLSPLIGSTRVPFQELAVYATQCESLVVSWKAGNFSDLQPKLANPVNLVVALINALRSKAVEREMDLVGVSGSVAQRDFKNNTRGQSDDSTDDT